MSQLHGLFVTEFDETLNRAHQRFKDDPNSARTRAGRECLQLLRRLKSIRDGMQDDDGMKIAVTNLARHLSSPHVPGLNT
jgi:hypothetical protein